jgi:hypothetical protein
MRGTAVVRGILLAVLASAPGAAQVPEPAATAVAPAAPVEPMAELRERVARLGNTQPTRLGIDVERKHRGDAPLHMRRTKKAGGAIVEYGPRGVESLEQWWGETDWTISLWQGGRKHRDVDEGDRLLSDVEAETLADPMGLLGSLLEGGEILAEEPASWRGQPARLLTIRPGPFSKRGEQGQGNEDLGPLALRLGLWLDERGDPLAMDLTTELALGPVLRVDQRQAFTFQRIDERLLVAEVAETWHGSALGVLQGKDDRWIVVRKVEPREAAGR